MPAEKGWGGRRPGAGRKRYLKVPRKDVKIRLSEAEQKKLQRLGGSEWVRQKLSEE